MAQECPDYDYDDPVLPYYINGLNDPTSQRLQVGLDTVAHHFSLLVD
jgi:hypothetical protein